MADLSTLPGFLLHCIEEDESIARAARKNEQRATSPHPTARAMDAAASIVSPPTPLWDSERVLAECAAKRRILEQSRELQQFADEYGINGPDGDDILESLAIPYAGRFGYRADWKPAMSDGVEP